MKSKKIISILSALAILIGILPASIHAADCNVRDNIIDITDKTVYEKKGLGSAKVTDIKITDADVVSATEDGTTIDIVLDSGTEPDATINIEFSTALDKNMNMSGHKTAVTLSEGRATIVLTLKGQYSSMSSLSGSVTYTLNFLVDEIPTAPPERIIESDTKSVYSGVATELNLKDYFRNAGEYYLINGDEKTLIDGKTYTFRSFTGGIHTLIFSASNANGECPDYVTVTIDVTEIRSGAWLGITTSNGSVNYVRFTDNTGNDIDGLTAYVGENNNIVVTLPRSFDVSGKITATFDLTQNNGLPKLSTSNAFNGSNDTKVYNTTLSNGTGRATMYLYNTHPKATNNSYTTYTISYAIENEIPTLREGIQPIQSAEITAGESYSLDLTDFFTDSDEDELTYSVKINGKAPVNADANYSFSPTLGGIYELEFFASDFMAVSVESFIVTLTVANSEKYYNMSVSLPDDIAPSFYITNGYDENGVDICADKLTAVKGETSDGYATYNVAVPENISQISVRNEIYGGMAIPATDGGVLKLCKVGTEIIDFANLVIPGSLTVSCGGHTATGVNGNFLLVPESEYTFSASPENTSVYSNKTETVTLTETTDTVRIKVSYKNPKTVITTSGATAKLFRFQNNYFVHTVYEPLVTIDNENGTSTHYFAAEGDLSYRVAMEGKLTKAGYIKTGNSVTVLHTENDRLPSDKVNYLTETSDAAIVGDDSLLININQRNHLSLGNGETKTLKAYRIWQIIDLTYNNHIIEPDFHFSILSGEDVISLEPVPDQPLTNGSGNMQKLTAIGEGTAVVEVTYDAIDIKGSSFNGLYGACDPSRCALFVVSAGLNIPEVDFGIESKTGTGSIVYKEENSKDWDAEFDTLYFFGETGEIRLSPSVKDGTVTEVAVSADKGESYLVLEAEKGIYTAPIVSGNNILRITTDNGTAYQIVRGDRIELSVKNNTHPYKPVAAGDEVSLSLIGVHTPIAKIAGTYNPGYKSNTEGDGGIHLSYSFGDESIRSEGKQYNFSREGTTIKFTVPENSEETEFTLTDGYIGFGVIGVASFPDDGESHRNIPDSGSGTRGSETTFHTRSILPDITVSIGMLPSDNTAPFIRENAPEASAVSLGGTYAIAMSKIFIDRDNDALTYTAKIGEGEATSVEDGYYTFTPDSTGTYTICFVANDGKADSDVHTVTLTVKEKSVPDSSMSSDDYDINDSEIDGYVTISFNDNGKRVEGEANVTYPKALGTIISSKRVPFTEGDTIADVTLRLLDSQGFSYQHTGTTKKGFYLASIGDFTLRGIRYDSFGEFDAGVGSGWMITLNKTFIEYGASEFEVKNGDTIKWQYTCQLGADIGDSFEKNSSSTKSDDIIKEEQTQQKKETPEKEEIKPNEEAPINLFTDTTFTDVKKGEWYYEAVKYVYENNLMQGTGNGFEPDSRMTRAMLVTVLYRMAQADKKENKHSFTDVAEGMWYSDSVAWVASNGIVNGVSDTEFAPDSYVTREQTALIIYRFAKLHDLDTTDTSELESFTDINEVSDWAVDSIRWAVSIGLINGTGSSALSPKDTSTRAQVATILMRFSQMNSMS